MKTVLITGACGGIGRACLQLFRQNGYRTFAHCRTDEKAVEGDFFQADLSSVEETLALATHCLEQGGVDILVNAAGAYPSPEGFTDMLIDELDRVMAVNFKAPLLLSQKLFPIMQERKWGRIINLSSIGVKYGGNPATIAYTASKSALETLTLALAKEGAPSNILANTIRVGVTNTLFHQKNPGKDMDARIKMIPLGRMANPEEIARMVLFLAEEGGDFMTGSTITVAGGE